MNPDVEVRVNADDFGKVLDRWLLLTRQELSAAINRRMFYVLLRLYILIPPKSVQELRQKITSYLDESVNSGMRRFDKKTGKQIGKRREFMRVHKIINAARGKAGLRGLYGEEMKAAAAKVRRRSIGSAGYLKSAVVLALRGIQPKFSQWGRRTKKANGIERAGNAELARIGMEYGVTGSHRNVAIMKGAKATVVAARPGMDPLAYVNLSIGIADKQEGRVDAIYRTAAAMAFADEKDEMLAHLGDVIDDAANKACSESQNGRAS